jgi:branched-chain amino acid transport system substrate-binding protein
MRTSRVPRLRALASFAALAVVAAGCSSGSSTAQPAGGADDPIIIGHTAGMTGFMSVFDIPVEQGMKMAIDDINAAGGVLGRQLKLVTTNNETDVSKIQSAALDVLEQGADFVVTSCDFDIGGPAARTVNEQNVIAMSCAGGPLYGYDGVGPLTYNMYPGSRTEGAMLAEYAKKAGYTKPYVIIDESLEYTQAIGDFFLKRWADLGGAPAGKDVYQNGDESAAAQIANIQRSGADVIIAASYPPGGATLLRQIRSAGLAQPILGAQGFDGTYWLDAVPGLSDFTIPASGSLHGDDPVQERNTFFKRVTEETGSPAASSNYPLSGYSAVQAFAVAAKRAGSVDTPAVQAALDAFTDEPLLTGPTTFTPTCHIPSGRPMLMLEYQNGKPAVVDQRAVESLMGEAPC